MSAWWWRHEDAAGAALTQERQQFPTRADAESWLGECWSDLADQGVAAVTLFEDERQVYGPMSLAAG
ncbi:MAG TPA: hypothetical protein PKK40_11880 [Marmoricola sp.]|mgnify:FL=1|nr:hypothetical protein [Marmoricola sp.]